MLTTGFPRRGRSFYLDDLPVKPGDRVLCKHDLVGGRFTPGNKYTVNNDLTLTNDEGDSVVPSARFIMEAC